MIHVSAIASGSNGNCYYIEDETDAVLIDAGISCKQIIERMKNLGLNLSKVRGLFLTHEHSDHIRGVEVFTKKNRIPVYVTEKTFQNSGIELDSELLNFFSIGNSVKLSSITVKSIPKNHDASDPCSYVVSAGGKKIAVLTDIGTPCKNVISVVKDSDALFLESNYDEEMLKNGSYPFFLKQRILGDLGHLSNYQAGLLVMQHATPKLKHVFLSHLSENNNTGELALATFKSIVKERKDISPSVILTSRYTETPLYRLD